MTRAEQILDEVRHLPTEERMDVLKGVVDLVAAPLSPEQEKGLSDAIDEADRGELVDGATAFIEMRRRLNGVG
jgi:hypothetical protein